MSSIIHKKVYQEFLNLLEEFQQELNSSYTTIPQEIWYKLQQFCQEKIFPLTDDDLDDSLVSQWRSLQIEILREFRLLNTDILFLGTSRQTNTKKARLNSIRDRIPRLIKFCQMVQELLG